MTKPADTSQNALDALNAVYSSFASFLPVANQFVERSLKAQQSIAGEVNDATHRWLDRRHEAVTSALGTTQQVFEKSLYDTNGAFAAMQEWYTAALERSAADLKTPFELFVAISGHVLPPESKTADKPSASIRRAA